jgi:hypothetical protein
MRPTRRRIAGAPFPQCRRAVGQSLVVTGAPDAIKQTDHAHRESGRDVMWFGVWSVIGAAYALAVIGAMTFGVFVLPVALLATLATVFHGTTATRSRGTAGLVSGAAFPLLYVAYLNREGPGTCAPRIEGSVMQQPVESMAKARYRRSTSGGRCDRVCPSTKHSAP